MTAAMQAPRPPAEVYPDVVDAARTWIGTPYRHRASLKGWGCDCIGLVAGVWRELGHDAPCALPVYSPDWAEIGGHDLMIDGLTKYLRPVVLGEARAGDVLAFRMRPGAVAKHAAILSEGTAGDARARIVHAYWGRAVVESWLGPYWRRHAVAAFRFPAAAEAMARKSCRGAVTWRR